MTQNGQIVAIKQDHVVVRVVRKGACGDNCSMCGACHNQAIEIKADCDIAVKVGETVCIRSESTAILFGLFSVFILPIALPLVCYFLMQSFTSVFWSGFGAAVMFLLCIGILLLLNKSRRFSAKTKAKVVCKL